MTPDNVRNLKAEVSAEAAAALGDTPEVQAFLRSSEPPMPPGVALGIGKREDGEHVLSVRVAPGYEVEGEMLSQRAHGEADVRVVEIVKRTTPAFLQARRDPLEPGVQIGMKGKGFVGTLGLFVKDARGVLYALTNSHVAADEGRAIPGHVIGQPFGTRPIGLLDRFVPFSRAAPNLVDAALVRLDRGVPAYLDFHASLPAGTHLHVRKPTPSDIKRAVFNIGRTFGARKGFVTAVEMDGVRVGYDQGTLTFNDQVEVSGGPTTDFSTGGHSGASIVTEDGAVIALLFAGGRDSTGTDLTYGNPMQVALSLLGVEVAA